MRLTGKLELHRYSVFIHVWGGGEGINGIKKIEIPIEIAAVLWYIYTMEYYSAI